MGAAISKGPAAATREETSPCPPFLSPLGSSSRNQAPTWQERRPSYVVTGGLKRLARQLAWRLVALARRCVLVHSLSVSHRWRSWELSRRVSHFQGSWSLVVEVACSHQAD